jgi:hypothetical protein
MDIPPESKNAEQLQASYRATGTTMFPDRERRAADKSRHPGMHITDSVAYAIILFGEMYAIMEEGETLMKAGDVLV